MKLTFFCLIIIFLIILIYIRNFKEYFNQQIVCSNKNRKECQKHPECEWHKWGSNRWQRGCFDKNDPPIKTQTKEDYCSNITFWKDCEKIQIVNG